MKNLFKILIPLILFLSGCSDDHNLIIDIDEGVQVKWIGCSNCGDLCNMENSMNECVWYIGSVPEFPDGLGDDEWDGGNGEIECFEITLFQDLGYFNFSTINEQNYIGSMNLSNYLWMWEEE